jgi:hypothetical protein
MNNNIKVTTERRSEVNLRKLARALISLAQRQLAEQNQDTTSESPTPPHTGEAA